MREPIEVNYQPESDDWLVTATGRGQTLTEKASGLIAARDQADQLVEQLAPEEEHRTVVHLLNGDALAFTSAYLSARLAKPTETPETSEPTPEPEAEAQEETPEPPTSAPTPRADSEESQRETQKA